MADESVDARNIQRLRDAGVEVIAVREIGPGQNDTEVLARAVTAGLVPLTEDKDFGDLIFRDRQDAFGAILLRATAATEDDLASVTGRVVSVLTEAEGQFVILDDRTSRKRPLR